MISKVPGIIFFRILNKVEYWQFWLDLTSVGNSSCVLLRNLKSTFPRYSKILKRSSDFLGIANFTKDFSKDLNFSKLEDQKAIPTNSNLKVNYLKYSNLLNFKNNPTLKRQTNHYTINWESVKPGKAKKVLGRLVLN